MQTSTKETKEHACVDGKVKKKKLLMYASRNQKDTKTYKKTQENSLKPSLN